MIFSILHEAALKGELLLIEGGICHWHIRKKDNVLVISEIISTKPGAGTKMLSFLKKQNATSILAKCPANLPSNDWWKKKGFCLLGTELTRSTKKPLNIWTLNLKKKGFRL